jgi:vacuolar-type H+-ATPase subunit F/Vma7
MLGSTHLEHGVMRVLVLLLGDSGLMVDMVREALAPDTEIEIRTLAEHAPHFSPPEDVDVVILTGIISPDLQEAIQRLRHQRSAPKIVVLGNGPLAGELYELSHRDSNISPFQLAELVRALARDQQDPAALAVKDDSPTLEATRSRV